MREKVSIFIEGSVNDEEESGITTKVIGHYSLFEGIHILRYEEPALQSDENSDIMDKVSENTIKISPGLVEMIKNGENSTHMVFDLEQPTQSVYDTPYGSLCFRIHTTRIDVEEKTDEIILVMEYSLSHDNSHISDNQIRILTKVING